MHPHSGSDHLDLSAVRAANAAPSGAGARSYTLAYALSGDLALAVALGVWHPASVSACASALWATSPALAAAVLATMFFIAKANVLRFGLKRGFSRLDCLLSAVACAGASLVSWALALLFAAHLGADFS